jgi:hypothetical protein
MRPMTSTELVGEYLLHAARQLSFPIQACNEAFACVRARCARADIGESTSNGSVNCTL